MLVRYDVLFADDTAALATRLHVGRPSVACHADTPSLEAESACGAFRAGAERTAQEQ